MSDVKGECFMHFVWATYLRQPLITPEIERDAHRIIGSLATRGKSELIAINGMPDHIHLLVRMGCALSISQYMNQVKGTSSRVINEILYPNRSPNDEVRFQWQSGYGMFSLGRNQVPHVSAYVANQKQHHADNTLHSNWEAPEPCLKPNAILRLAPDP